MGVEGQRERVRQIQWLVCVKILLRRKNGEIVFVCLFMNWSGLNRSCIVYCFVLGIVIFGLEVGFHVSGLCAHVDELLFGSKWTNQ